MNGFVCGIALQWKLDIRSKSLLVACYIVPLIFFLLMGGIFTSVMPEMRSTLIQSMIVMSVSMGAFIGLPPSLLRLEFQLKTQQKISQEFKSNFWRDLNDNMIISFYISQMNK